MQRKDWTFEFTARKLAEAAVKKVEFHQGRVKFWQGAKESVMKDIKESGIEVNESAAGANYTKGGFSPQVMVRHDLQEKLTECHQKIQQHHQHVTEYEGWVQVLSANADKSLALNADDYLFFFGN